MRCMSSQEKDLAGLRHLPWAWRGDGVNYTAADRAPANRNLYVTLGFT